MTCKLPRHPWWAMSFGRCTSCGSFWVQIGQSQCHMAVANISLIFNKSDPVSRAGLQSAFSLEREKVSIVCLRPCMNKSCDCYGLFVQLIVHVLTTLQQEGKANACLAIRRCCCQLEVPANLQLEMKHSQINGVNRKSPVSEKAHRPMLERTAFGGKHCCCLMWHRPKPPLRQSCPSW